MWLAQQLAQAGAIPGPSSPIDPTHWKTISVIAAICTFTLLCVPFYFLRKRIAEFIEGHLAIRVLFLSSGVLAAIGLSILSSYFDIFKRTTYDNSQTPSPDWHTVFWVVIWTVVASYYACVGFFGVLRKETQDGDVKRLKAESLMLESQRSTLARIVEFAGHMVTKKRDRLATCLKDYEGSLPEFCRALSPQTQLSTIVNLTHEFFKNSLKVGESLRVGLYLKKAGEPPRLGVAFSSDGSSHDEAVSNKAVFSNKSEEYMGLQDPRGDKSEVVKCYHSSEGFRIIPDCVQAEKDGSFTYLYPEQPDKLKSLVAFRYNYQLNGQHDAIIVSLVSSQKNLFRKEDEAEIKLFLKEMMSRFVLESVVLELTKCLQKTSKTAVSWPSKQ